MKRLYRAPVIVLLMVLCILPWSAGCGGGGGGGGGGSTQPPRKLSTFSGEDFSIVILPDTQMYSHLYPKIFIAQTQWIADNVLAHDIRFVLHEGDVVNIPGPTTQQWERAVAALNKLDGVVPYALAIGNHDYDDEGVTRASTLFNRFFPLDKFRREPTFGGYYEEGKMDNTYHLFRAGGTDWMILSLEFGPRDNVLVWADRMVKNYPARRVIVLTHAYLHYDNALLGAKPDHASLPENMGIAQQTGGANNGVKMWEKFVSQNKNIAFVFNGHTGGDGAARRISNGIYGNLVFQALANYQYFENGGNGYLRIMRFEPSQARVSVRTYSPWLKEELTDEQNKFTFDDVEFGAP